MGTDVLALIIFVAVVIIAFLKKMNVGLLAIAVAVVLGRFFGIKDSEIIAGFSTSLFSTLVGITFLFTIVNSTGALELGAKKIVSLVGKKIWLIPIFVYMAGFIIAAVGPGAIPALAIIPPLAVTLALQVGYHPVMLALIGVTGLMAGRMTSITPEGILISGIITGQGLDDVMFSVLMSNIIVTVTFSIITYIVYKGYKVKSDGKELKLSDVPKFTAPQMISLAGILVMLLLIIFVKINVGLAAFLVATTLIFFKVGDESVSLKNIPWGTIMLVLGVGVLMNIVDKVGGIKVLSNALSSIMRPKTAAPIMGITSGLLSWVSSALGVVYPTLIPTVSGIVKSVGGVTVAELVAAIGAGGSCAGISPASTGGALILAALASNKENFTKEEEGKVFVSLFLWAVFALFLIAALAFLGLFRIF